VPCKLTTFQNLLLDQMPLAAGSAEVTTAPPSGSEGEFLDSKPQRMAELR